MKRDEEIFYLVEILKVIIISCFEDFLCTQISKKYLKLNNNENQFFCNKF